MKRFYIFCACVFSFLAIIYAAGHKKSDCLEKETALTLLETAEDLLTKAGDSFPTCKGNVNSTECGSEKSLSYVIISKRLISELREHFPTCPEPIVEDITKTEKPSDCSEVLASGHNKSGNYTIWPGEKSKTRKPLKVYCDMETDGGGWTVIQRRGKFPVQQDFYQDWESYKNGFGNISQEFWLGNENIKVLCRNECKMRFDFQDKDGEKSFALYQSFILTTSNYRLTISGYSGNAGDAMKFHDTYDFSTKDHGFIKGAVQWQGGWWYGANLYCNLNAVYQPLEKNALTVFWWEWRRNENLASVEIKVMPK